MIRAGAAADRDQSAQQLIMQNLDLPLRGCRRWNWIDITSGSPAAAFARFPPRAELQNILRNCLAKRIATGSSNRSTRRVDRGKARLHNRRFTVAVSQVE